MLDSGGGAASGNAWQLSGGSLGGTFQSGTVQGSGYRLEAGWVRATEQMAPAVTGDFNGDGRVTFADFVLFAAGYGRESGDEGYDPRFDLDGNRSTDFADFVIFAATYGR